MADITKAVEGWKPAGTLYPNYLENHLRRINYINYKLLIECFTLACLDLELQWLISQNLSRNGNPLVDWRLELGCSRTVADLICRG